MSSQASADYVLTCCSTADYPRSFFTDRNVPFVSFHYELNGKLYSDDLYESMAPHEFFGLIKAGAQPKTSQVSVGEYIEFWQPFLEGGSDILHVTLSSGITGTYGSACLAAEQLKVHYPEREIRVIDSRAASSGYGLLVEELADRRDRGFSLGQLADWAEENKLRVNHWFFVSDLETLKRGGRVNPASAVLASALKICPVMNVDAEGCLIPREKVRTKKRAEEELARIMQRVADGGKEYCGLCCISHSDCEEDARRTAELVEEGIPHLAGRVRVCNIGAVIGSHTGPGTVALFFLGEPRVD